ncbi:MAG TPA: metallophosphoesterase family protein [Solirubrobacterales bacterium]|nr:metallophosphoesterase family protein [Solirubrobacterales bacterium]
MKILAFSDLHTDMETAATLVERSPSVDVVIGAGDFASQHRGLEETIEVLAGIETPALLVPGNNETVDALRSACEQWPAATVLHGEAAEVDGQAFFGLGAGIPITPWDWSYDLSEEDAAEMIADCPGEGVLILHSPPHGHCDESHGSNLGSTALAAAIEERRLALAVCGHIHESWGARSRIGGTEIANLGPDGAIFEV